MCTYALTNGQTDSRTEIVIFRALAGAKNWTCSQQGQALDLHELLFANISQNKLGLRNSQNYLTWRLGHWTLWDIGTGTWTQASFTAPHSKPCRFLNDAKDALTPLKNLVGLKFRGVLKNSGNSLVDRH